MPPLSARPLPPDSFRGELDVYRVRDTADCDHQLTIIASRMRLLDNPKLMRKHLADRDELLARRHALECRYCATKGAR